MILKYIVIQGITGRFSDGWVAVQVGQVVGVEGLGLLHDGGDDRARDGFMDGLGCFSLNEFSDGGIAVHALEVGVVPQHFVCQILCDFLLNIGE